MNNNKLRLVLGISNVGTIVIIVSLSLYYKIPSRLIVSDGSVISDILVLLAVILIYILINLPFDIIGGYILPKHFQKTDYKFSDFILNLSKGILNHSLAIFLLGLTIYLTGKYYGPYIVLPVSFGLLLILIIFQQHISGLIGNYTTSKFSTNVLNTQNNINHQSLLIADSNDEMFTGALCGLPGKEKLIFPRKWIDCLKKETLEILINRRNYSRISGNRIRGIIVAVAWNLSGLAIINFLPNAGYSTITQFVYTILWFTIWSFLGLLILPTFSRIGVYAVDKYAKLNSVPQEKFSLYLDDLKTVSSDEEKRPNLVETIFHPIPSLENRVEKLDSTYSFKGAWNAARNSIYYSWLGMGFLSRSVHCNCGKPDLWVFLPCD